MTDGITKLRRAQQADAACLGTARAARTHALARGRAFESAKYRMGTVGGDGQPGRWVRSTSVRFGGCTAALSGAACSAACAGLPGQPAGLPLACSAQACPPELASLLAAAPALVPSAGFARGAKHGLVTQRELTPGTGVLGPMLCWILAPAQLPVSLQSRLGMERTGAAPLSGQLPCSDSFARCGQGEPGRLWPTLRCEEALRRRQLARFHVAQRVGSGQPVLQSHKRSRAVRGLQTAVVFRGRQRVREARSALPQPGRACTRGRGITPSSPDRGDMKQPDRRRAEGWAWHRGWQSRGSRAARPRSW